MPTIQLSPKQNLAFNLLNDPKIVEVLFGGGAGGGKSLLVTLWAVIQCRQYSGIVIGLGRKEISNLGKTTVKTLLTKTHPLLGVKKADFKYVSPGNTNPGIYYKNGSSIILLDLAPAPSDPDYDRFGSLELTHVIFEEVGEIVQKARSVLTSRKNRMLNVEYDIVGKTVLTCNPSQNFVRDEFYEPYLALGGGDYQVWTHGQVERGGEMKPAMRAFVRSLPTDNPFLSRNYLETLRNLPQAERRRLMEGDWDFDDDTSKLFKAHLFRTVAAAKAGEQDFFGCDPSRGGDATVFTQLRGGTVVDQYQLEIPRTKNLDIGGYVAEHYIQWVIERGGSSDHAALDVVGIGASVLDACNRLGFYVQAYNAGSTKGVRQLDHNGDVIDPEDNDRKGVPLFNNIRSQTFYDMAQAAQKGELTFLEDLPHYAELKRELSAHHYTPKERAIVVDDKKKVKERLGRSPDFADSLQAAWWCKSNVREQFDFASHPAKGSESYVGSLYEQVF